MAKKEPLFVLVDSIGSFADPIIRFANAAGFDVAMNPHPTSLNEATIIWCDWADKNAAILSRVRRPNAKLIVRCHAYEAYYGAWRGIEWGNVDAVVFVADHVREQMLRACPWTGQVQAVDHHIMRSGVDVEKWPLKTDCELRHRIAYVGRICPPKNAEQLLFMAYELPDWAVHFMGPFQDARCEEFFHYHADRLPNVFWHPPDGDGPWWSGRGVNEFLEECDFIASPSYAESTHMALLEGMAKGLAPLCQARPGAVAPVTYDSPTSFHQRLTELHPGERWRQHVKEHHSEEAMEREFLAILESLA